jgi:anti-sigma regulatory factor (Ser/Thr protein kinase)
MEFRYEIEGGNFSRAGHASSAVKKILKQLNVDNRVIKRVVVALYEGEVNVVAHADKGSMLVDIDEKRIRIRIEDSGPGIPDIDLAMQAGFSTASAAVREMGFGAGMGLPNMKKNTDQMIVTSEVGKGTQVEMITWFSQ